MFMLRNTFVAAVFLTSLLAGCSRDEVQSNEIVMCPGSSLFVEIAGSSFLIKSTGIFSRNVETGRLRQSIDLIPRNERWYGSFGLFNAEAGDANTHVVIEEGFQHFSSVDDLRNWIDYERRQIPLEYTSDGLLVAARYQTRPPGLEGGPDSAMNIKVWRLLINDTAPVGLPGAHNERFKKIALSPQTCSKPAPFTPSSRKEIGGRRYSGRAIDIMNERGFKPADVERIIKTGRRSDEGERIMFYDNDYTNHISFVDTRADGSVVQIG